MYWPTPAAVEAGSIPAGRLSTDDVCLEPAQVFLLHAYLGL